MSWERLDLSAPEFALPREPPTLCGLIYRGRRHLVSGPPESTKTLFALIIGLELIGQGECFALIDFESGPVSTRTMLVDLGASPEELAAVHYVEADSSPDADDVAALIASGATLAIIDAAAGAYSVSELDDHKRADAERFGQTWIDPLWRVGVATLTLDHVTKSTETRGKWAIGSERKTGRVDVHLGLEVALPLSRGRNGLVRIISHKGRPGWLPRPRAAELELRSDPQTHAIEWEFKASDGEQRGDDWRPTVLMERVSRFLETQPEAVSRHVIEQQVTGKAKYLRRAMDALIADGFVLESRGPGSSRLLSLAKPFRPFVPGSSPLVPDDDEPRFVPSSLPLQGGTRTRDEVPLDESKTRGVKKPHDVDSQPACLSFSRKSAESAV